MAPSTTTQDVNTRHKVIWGNRRQVVSDNRRKVIWGTRRKVIWGRRQVVCAVTALLLTASTFASAQEPAESATGRQPSHQPTQIIDDASKVAPLTTAGRFKLAAGRSWIGVATAATGLWHPESTEPDAPQIPEGFSTRFGVAVADNTLGSFMTTAVAPSLFHQDPRYFAKGSGNGFASRAAYAASRTLVTRGDSGRSQFNYSRVAGTAGAVGISNLYNSSTDHSVSGALTSIGIRLAVDAAANELREFWPDIRRTVFRH